ncbi:MAG TPA: hypothetical protein VES59_02070 [Bacteroidota bacterium]|nr:hypothetical protein [Bacteroidota bacterium]
MNDRIQPRSWLVVGLLTLLLVLGLILLPGCSEKQDLSSGPATSQLGPPLSLENQQVRSVMAVQDRHTSSLMADRNVIGTATGLTDDGRLAVLVLLENPIAPPVKGSASVSNLPRNLEGIPVVEMVVGKIRPLANAAAHQVKQTPPIQLGTSGGWRYDLANGFCCSGTLGSLIHVGTTQYVLSNYHVFWGDIVPGGNGRVATAGDPVIQPGLVDVACDANGAQNVANLSGSGSLPAANVDVGYAQVISGLVRTDGAILDVGTISASTTGAFIGQAVKKSGRSSGITRSSVNGLNATVSVQYDNECAGAVAFTKTFTGQILVKNKFHGQSFLIAGDSGSLMVEDVSTNPRAVGLLYAGSSTTAVANAIGDVLSWVSGNAGGSAGMVGQ